MEDHGLEWETLDSTTAYSCPGFDIQRDDVRLPDDTTTTFDYLVEPESVVIIPFTPDDRLVIIEEWRQAVGRVSRGFPAGGVEPTDTDLAAAAHRELTEETGYIADTVTHLITVEPANGITNAVHHYYVATDCLPNGERALDHNETIRVDTTTYDQLHARVTAGKVRDGRTILGVLYYDLTRNQHRP